MENPMVNYQNIIADTTSKNFNVRDEYKDNSYDVNVAIQKGDQRPFSIGVINITGELNVGMMLRSACLFGAEKFYIFGRKKFDKRSTVGAEKYIDIVQYTYDDPMHADELILNDLRNLNHRIFLCEHGGLTLGSEDCKTEFLSSKNNNPLFLFGSESHGIPQIILDQVDSTGYPDYEFTRISIPQVGVMRSFNVSAACNIIMWSYIQETYL